MNMSIEAKKNAVKETTKALKKLQKKVPSAISDAINRAATNVNKNTKLELKKEYNIKSKDIQSTLTKTRAKRSKLSAEVRSEGQLIPLDKFKVSPKTVNPKRNKPIKIGVKKGGVKAVLGAFVAEINGKKVFQRSTKNRLPIRRLFGPSIPQMLGNEGVRVEIERQGQEVLYKRLNHQINRIIEQGRV